MKKVLALLLAAMMMISLTACGPKACKERGCDLEPVQDGYCAEHYVLHQLEGLLG